MATASLSSLQTENLLLKQKVNILSCICKDHKSQNEQIKAKFFQDLKRKEQQHRSQLNQFQKQMDDQQQIIQFIQHQLETTLIQTAANRNKSTQSIQTLEKQHRLNLRNIQKLKQDLKSKQHDIDTLKNELSVKDKTISSLKQQIWTALQKYIIHQHIPSPSTIQVTTSLPIRHESHRSMASESAIFTSARIFMHHYISPIPRSMDKSNKSSKSGTASNTDENTPIKDQIPIKWSNQFNKPPPIDMSLIGLINRQNMMSDEDDVNEAGSSDTDHDQDDAKMPFALNRSKTITPFVGNTPFSRQRSTGIYRQRSFAEVDEAIYPTSNHTDTVQQNVGHVIKNSATAMSEDEAVVSE